MEKQVRMMEDYGFSEREFNGEKFAARGFLLTDGIDTFYGEMTGEYASKNRDTNYDSNVPYVVKGFWKHRVWGENKDRHENAFYITDLQVM